MESSCHLLPQGSDHSGDDMQGLGHVSEDTQPVALLSSLSVTPYNPTLQRNVILYVPLNTPQIHSPSITNTQQSRQAPISDILSSMSVSPSISPIVCLSFMEKKPTCVSTLSRHGCPAPTAQASCRHKAGHLKRLRSAGYVAFGVQPPS
ncbi:hypothetical protein KUCAC02_001916 [Chaenocephalus aceratus]|uniref:Uncharacterized protein n=1 Tax=Chaenocephalus aceratus TaxID=36190 RepID=A0ACB9XS51_CHAAC|nr:hypothetical protein KUCAC02_001916 [Chaenocephalus aceratus]